MLPLHLVMMLLLLLLLLLQVPVPEEELVARPEHDGGPRVQLNLPGSHLVKHFADFCRTTQAQKKFSQLPFHHRGKSQTAHQQGFLRVFKKAPYRRSTGDTEAPGTKQASTPL